ncbi:MAG: efflux RND transporter periplasmic adaptor subunit, partial [Planctomycetes bacterium]|nr:efflux RND transporter periplasmic adaptor subunit [Planctomycetota bacterium]
MKSKSLFAVLVIVATAGCNQSPAPVPSAKASDGKGATSTQPPIKVSRITPTRKTLVRVVEQPGQVEAFEEAPLYSKVTGYVESLKVDLGDRVKGPQFDSTGNVVEPGQVLCELSVPEVIEELHQ